MRKYQDRPVEEEKLARMAQAAALAPSAHHTTPWHLTIITAPAVIGRLARAMASSWDRDMLAEGIPAGERERRTRRSVRRFDGAPAMILACLDRRSVSSQLTGVQARCEEIMMTQSVAAAIYAVLLAAAYEGLGAAWQCPPLYCPDAVREALGLPPYLVPQGAITVGYAETDPGSRPARAAESAIAWIRGEGSC